MKVSLSRLKVGKAENDKDAATLLSDWIGPEISKEPAQPTDVEEKIDQGPVSNRPIEPETGRLKGPGILKWLIFILIIGYAVLSYYRVPMLTALPATSGERLIEVPRIDLELVFLGFGQYGDRHRGGVDAPTLLSGRHALEPMSAGLVDECEGGIPSTCAEQKEPVSRFEDLVVKDPPGS